MSTRASQANVPVPTSLNQGCVSQLPAPTPVHSIENMPTQARKQTYLCLLHLCPSQWQCNAMVGSATRVKASQLRIGRSIFRFRFFRFVSRLSDFSTCGVMAGHNAIAPHGRLRSRSPQEYRYVAIISYGGSVLK
eukprot:8310076-Pyramimonas_sp.AAC.1